MSRDILTVDRIVLPTLDDGSPQSVAEPIDLDTVKDVLRFTSDSEDALIRAWMTAARQHFEEQTGRFLLTQQREWILDGSPASSTIEIPHPPLQSVESIRSVDDTGAETELDPSTYVVTPSAAVDLGSPAAPGYVDPHCPPGCVRLTAGTTWPTLTEPGQLKIRYTCGYGGDDHDVPQLVKACLYLLIGHFHRNRVEVGVDEQYELPLGARSMIRAFRDSGLLRQSLRTA